MTANIVDLAHMSLVDDQVDGLTVILDIEPVSEIKSLDVYRQRLVVESIDNHERDQLLRKMI